MNPAGLKVSLVNLVSPQDSEFYPPVGIMSIAAALRKKKVSVSIFHEPATRQNLRFILEKSRGSLFTGLSVMTGKTLVYNLELSSLLKTSGIPVVWGGIHPTFLPEGTLKEKYVDFIIMGEGEECICNFLDSLVNGDDFKNIGGLGYKKNGEIFFNERAPLVSSLDDYKLDWDDIAVSRYLRREDRQQKFMPYLTSRGCPHRCGFCYNLDFNHRQWRARDAGQVIGEITYLKDRHKFDGVDFIDDNFFTDKKRAFSIIQGIKMPWMAEVRADYVNEGFIRDCKSYNCYKLIIGCESGSNRMLKLMNKDVSLAQIEDTVSLCYKYGIKVYCSFMIMMPQESNQDRDQTLEFINMLMDKHEGIEIDGPKIYTPYPGTPFYRISKDLGWVEPPDTRHWSFYHRSMNPLLLRYICGRDIKRYRVLLNALAFKGDILKKQQNCKRKLLGLPVAYALGLYKKIFEWRLKKKIIIFPLDIKLYFWLLMFLRKISSLRKAGQG